MSEVMEQKQYDTPVKSPVIHEIVKKIINFHE